MRKAKRFILLMGGLFAGAAAHSAGQADAVQLAVQALGTGKGSPTAYSSSAEKNGDSAAVSKISSNLGAQMSATSSKKGKR